eukprot:2237608-Alexandrium_andersonii.AAC.1
MPGAEVDEARKVAPRGRSPRVKGGARKVNSHVKDRHFRLRRGHGPKGGGRKAPRHVAARE